jgi:hypothetical protein
LVVARRRLQRVGDAVVWRWKLDERKRRRRARLWLCGSATLRRMIQQANSLTPPSSLFDLNTSDEMDITEASNLIV